MTRFVILKDAFWLIFTQCLNRMSLYYSLRISNRHTFYKYEYSNQIKKMLLSYFSFWKLQFHASRTGLSLYYLTFMSMMSFVIQSMFSLWFDTLRVEDLPIDWLIYTYLKHGIEIKTFLGEYFQIQMTLIYNL
jgi:hypothetical protein